MILLLSVIVPETCNWCCSVFPLISVHIIQFYSYHKKKSKMDDNLYNQILNFYTSTDQKYPQHIYDLDPAKRVNAKSQFRQTAKPFRADGGTLFQRDKEVLVKTHMSSILKACHDNPATGGTLAEIKPSVKYLSDITGKA